MRTDLRTVTALFASFALVLLYLVFVLRFIVLADWSNMSRIELWIFITMLLRIIILAVLGRRFELPPLVPIVVFSIESLLIPPLLALFVITGNTAYASVMGTILTAWIGVSAVLLSPYLIYDFGRYLRSDPSLWGIFFLAILEFAFNLFTATLLSGTTQSMTGFSGLGSYFVLSLRSYATSSGVPFSSGSLLISISSLIFFLSLLVLATVGHMTLETNLKLRHVLLVPLIALLVLIAWIGVAASLTSNMFNVLSVPAIALVILVWGGSHGKA